VTQQVSSPPEKTEQPPLSQPLAPPQEAGFSRPVIIIWLVVIGMLLLLFTGQMVRYLPQLVKSPLKTIAPAPHVVGIVPATGSDVIQIPGHASKPAIQLPTGRYVIYEMQNTISVISTDTDQSQVLTTPGYIYNSSASPILTPNDQILYSGNGLWLTNISGGTPLQIATLPDNQVITSLALSRDGTTVAWSTQPLDGNGQITIYAGPLKKSVPVYQHSASDCPCFRVFSFLHDTSKQGNSTLLLADDRGDHRAVQYGLWSLNLAQKPLSKPHQLLSSAQTAGPQVLAPNGSTLLYSSYEGFVPAPTDESAPTDTTSLTYANSLNIAALSGNTPLMSASQVVLPAQNELSNSEAYHWETTPTFAPDGHTLLYIEFSSDAYAPYSRHSALYSVKISGSGTHLTVGTPQLLVTTPAHFIELGAWLNQRIITFYADGSLYAFDTHSDGYKQLINTGFYTHIIATGSQGSH
jgi:hypothetical protein